MQSLQTSPRVQSKAHSPAEAQLAQFSDGSIVALSLSEPGRAYHVTLAPARCDCPGFQHRGRCYHVAAAAERFGTVQVQCGSCGQPVARSEAHASQSPYSPWAHNDYVTCQSFIGDARRQRGAW